MSKLFERNIENFKCIVCGQQVDGNGYTNHCPKCLSSLHVDINPGDRASTCQGVMYAIGYEIKNGAEFILHQCSKCGFQRKNKVSPKDSRKALIALSSGTFNPLEYKK